MGLPPFTPDMLVQRLKQAQGMAVPAPTLTMPTASPIETENATSDAVLPTAQLADGPIAGPPTALQSLQKKRDYLLDSGSGIDQIKSPLGRGLARTADVIGSVFAPKIDRAIPGTQLHHDVLVAQAQQNLATEVANQKEQATTAGTVANTAHTAAETPTIAPAAADRHDQSVATVANLNSETTARDNPAPEYEVHDTVQGPMIVNKSTGIGQHMTADGLPVGPKVQTKEVQLQIGGKPHSVLVNDTDGTLIKDLGESGIKPPTVNVNAGEAALDRESKQFGAPHQKSLDAANAQLEKIADARSMINGNAEAQGLGIPKVLTALVGGQGTGVRITQAELTSIAHARGLSGDIEGTLNKLAGKGALSKEQQTQLTQIMDDVKARIQQKQSIASGALDTINGAATREQIVAADKAARKSLADLESGAGDALITVQIPGQAPGQIHASQKAAFLTKYPNAKVQ